MADVSGDRPWYEELAPDLEGDAGRGVELETRFGPGGNAAGAA